MELRDYQIDIINRLRGVLRTYNSPIVVLGCGGGKSVISAHIAKMATMKGNAVLVLVHRIELIEQLRDTYSRYGVDMNLCDISMIVSALKLNKDYKLIITDEAHHNTCNTYKRVYEKFPNAKRINVTATPCRTDGRGLGETCDYLMETVSVKWLIENKYLAPYEYYTINLSTVDLKGIKKVRGEYEDITELMTTPKVYGDIFKYYKKGSKAICYCSSIEHSKKTAEEFNNRGIPARHIDGKTPKEERKEIINDFRSGKIMVLCNFSLIAEGFDVPDCYSVLILRKTTSLNLFIQMAMRCMRYKENKIAMIYDFCGNAYEHGLPDDDREWTLDSKKSNKINSSGEPDVIVRTCKECFKTYSGTGRICPYCGADNGKTRKQIEEEKTAELMRIKKIEKKKLKDAGKSLADLIAYGKEKGYSPKWAILKWKILEKYRRKYGK